MNDQVKKILLCVDEDAIADSARFELNNPILMALKRQTLTLWHFFDEGYLLEAMSPYRACLLPDEALELWRHFQQSGQMTPFECELEMHFVQVDSSHNAFSPNSLSDTALANALN